MSANRAPGVGKGFSEVLIQYGINQGLSIAECIKNSGLPANFLASQVDVSSVQEIILIRNLLNKTHKPFATGFAIGKNFHFGALGMVGMAMMTSKNGKDIAKIVSRYLESAYHPTEPKMQLLAENFKMSWHYLTEFDEQLGQFLIARDVGIFGAIQDHYLQDAPKEVLELGFTFPYCSGMDDMERYFSCRVLSEQQDNYLIAKQSQLQKTMPLHNPIASTTTEKYYQDHLKRHASPTGLVEKLQHFIIPKLRDATEMKDAANALNMSTRSLARQLEKHNTNWRNLIAQIRIEQAERVLLDSDMSLWDIAEAVGFASPSSFSHAFTKHKGVSPSAFRKNAAELALADA